MVDQKLIRGIKDIQKITRFKAETNGEASKLHEQTTGMRQGCPLSGLLFAICVDVLIRRISAQAGPEGCIRAFADDIASIIPELRHLPKYRNAFNGFAKISGLALKLKKCVIIPLGFELTPARHDKIKE